MPLGLVGDLSALVATKYNAAKTAHALTFSVTELTIVHVSGLPVRK